MKYSFLALLSDNEREYFHAPTRDESTNSYRTGSSLRSHEVDHRCNNGCDDNPYQLKPVEKWDAEQLWIYEIVKRRPEQGNKGDDEQEKKCSAVSPRSRP